MIPYLAIIKDSFRAALGSNTLRVLFGVVTLLLLALVPFGQTEMLTGRIGYREIWDWRQMMDLVFAGQQQSEPNAGKQIWSLLTPPMQQGVKDLYREIEETERKRKAGETVAPALLRAQDDRINTFCYALHNELDEKVLADEDFYDPRVWDDLTPNEELQGLLDMRPEDMAERQIRRRNRLLLEAAFPGLVPRSPPLAILPTYFGMPIGRAEGNTKDAVVEWYRGWIGWLINWPVGTLIVFVAIIATAGIMPRMFEPGSISLLLSKPITRSRLFLAQFAGACAFMLLVSVYFTVGVWLIEVLRLGIWNPNVFLCIPLFMLIFAVYYSVSAYIGLLYRSAVMSVFGTILFFCICFSLALAKVTYDDMFVDAARLVHVIDTGDVLIASNDALTETRNYTFDEENREWKDIYIRQGMAFDAGKPPVYDAQGNQLLSVVSLGFSQVRTLSVGRARDAWVRKQGVLVPDETIELLIEPDGGVLAVARSSRNGLDPGGFLRLKGEAVLEEDEQEKGDESQETVEAAEEGEVDSSEPDVDDDSEKPAEDAAGTEGKAEIESEVESSPQPDEGNGIDADALAKAFPYDFVGPDKLPLPTEPPMAVTIDPSSSRIVFFGNGQINVYDKNAKGEYVEKVRRDLHEGQEKAATLAAAGSVIVVALNNGQVFILSADTLDTIQTLSPEGEVPARFAAASDDGAWVAILFHNRELWLYDTRNKKLTKPNIWTQGDISAVGFSGNRLLIVDRIARVREFDLPSMKQTRVFSPRQPPYLSEAFDFLGVKTNYYMFHKWIVSPLYAILPKPGELGWAVNYLATGEQTNQAWWSWWFQRGESTSDERHQLRDPWRGVRSCAIFVVFMLILSCWKISRTEF